MIREILENIDNDKHISSIDNLEHLRSDLNMMFLKTNGKLKTQFKRIIQDLDSILKMDLIKNENIDESWVDKFKAFFKTYKVTKKSALPDDITHISSLIYMIISNFETEDNAYLSDKMEFVRIKFDIFVKDLARVSR